MNKYMRNYCTYLTIYKGNLLPPLYIGSTSINRLESGYRGSVCSKEYKRIWKSELKNNPHLFKTSIVTTHETRKEATAKELHFQLNLDVVKSPLYINLSFAKPNGFFGRNSSPSNKGAVCWNNGEVDIYRKDYPGDGWVQGNCEKTKLNKSKAVRVKGEEHHNFNRVRSDISNDLFIAGVSKNYIVTYPDGTIKKIKGLNEFCKENNLNPAGAHRVMSGTQKHYKNFIFRKDL